MHLHKLTSTTESGVRLLRRREQKQIQTATCDVVRKATVVLAAPRSLQCVCVQLRGAECSFGKVCKLLVNQLKCLYKPDVSVNRIIGRTMVWNHKGQTGQPNMYAPASGSSMHGAWAQQIVSQQPNQTKLCAHSSQAMSKVVQSCVPNINIPDQAHQRPSQHQGCPGKQQERWGADNLCSGCHSGNRMVTTSMWYKCWYTEHIRSMHQAKCVLCAKQKTQTFPCNPAKEKGHATTSPTATLPLITLHAKGVSAGTEESMLRAHMLRLAMMLLCMWQAADYHPADVSTLPQTLDAQLYLQAAVAAWPSYIQRKTQVHTGCPHPHCSHPPPPLRTSYSQL